MAAKVAGIVSKKESNGTGEEEPIIINLNSPPRPETGNKIDINLNSPPPADEPRVVRPPLSQRLSSLHSLILGANMEKKTQAQSQAQQRPQDLACAECQAQPQAQHQAQPKGETKTQTQAETQAQTKGTTPTRGNTSGGANGQPVGRQGSLDLCRKTAAEVWLEVYKKNPHLIRGSRPIDKPSPAQKLPTLLPRPPRNQNPSPVEKQPNLGDMTLENFLVHAGVVRENPPRPPASGPPQPRPRAYVNQSIGQPSGVAPPPEERRSVTTGGALPAHRGWPQPGEGIGVSVAGANPTGPVTSGANPTATVTPGANPTGPSNRESAARSRARKQAYTDALEGELKKVQGELQELRDENTRLLQGYGEAARVRPKLLDEKCKELRRTSSSFV